MRRAPRLLKSALDYSPTTRFFSPLGSYKDASEALQAGDGEAIRQSIWNKRSYVPQSIIDGRDLFDLVIPAHGRTLIPLRRSNDVAGGLPR